MAGRFVGFCFLFGGCASVSVSPPSQSSLRDSAIALQHALARALVAGAGSCACRSSTRGAGRSCTTRSPGSTEGRSNHRHSVGLRSRPACHGADPSPSAQPELAARDQGAGFHFVRSRSNTKTWRYRDALLPLRPSNAWHCFCILGADVRTFVGVQRPVVDRGVTHG